MFTGLVETVGEVSSASMQGREQKLVIRSSFRDLSLGESISVSGVCLTVDALPEDGTFSVFASHETLERTTLATLRAGGRVNLERALLPTTRMGGHIVTGHVDGIGSVGDVSKVGSAVAIEISFDRSLARFVAEKGSIAVDGVSLTVNGVGDASFAVLVIPHTLAATTLGTLRKGSRVNLEVDVLARYAARILETKNESPSWAERLLEKR